MRPRGGRLIDGRGGLLRRAELVCHCLLIDSGAGPVLVDTGTGSPGVDRPDEWLGRPFVRRVGLRTSHEETALAQVQGLGHAAEDVRHVVLTHLDLDHAGGLIDFPRATVHVYAEELRAAESASSARERARYRSVQFAHGPQWSTYSGVGERWFGFDAVRDLKGLPPEILLVPLAGHSRGHAGVAVDTGDGWLLHAGDAYFFSGEADPAEPRCPPGQALAEALVQTERRARLDNQQRLRELARDHGAEVTQFCAHSAADLRRMTAR
jgi:glyoxylase-like metal-dependent hydrolase (beta-lactamase superfamily II)